MAGLVVAAGLLAPDLVGGFVERMASPPRQTAHQTPGQAAHPAAQQAVPAAAAYAGGHVRLAADPSGHYFADIRINGRPLGALVDTGASLVVLRYEDARALGLVYAGDGFEVVVQTANGQAKAHRVKLDAVRLGSITIEDVDGLVMEEGVLQSNLLGMSFLRRLSRYEVRDGALLLER